MCDCNHIAPARGDRQRLDIGDAPASNQIVPSADRPRTMIDLDRVRENAESIARATRVPLIAVVKADAYGLGAARVAGAIADLVEAFYVFDAAEAVRHGLAATGKPTIALLGKSRDPADYVSHRIRPAVWTVERALALRAADPILAVDAGQQRFGCPLGSVESILQTGAVDEAFTHATVAAQARRLEDALRGRVSKLHAAGSALLDEPGAWLDAVRPGLALYRGAARVTARLAEARDATGPAGYTGFTTPAGRHGVIVAGYSDGLRPGGPCLVNGQPHRLPEVGMQSAFVELGTGDRAGDEVVLLGDGLTEEHVASAWGTSPHEVLVRLCGLGARSYLS